MDICMRGCTRDRIIRSFPPARGRRPRTAASTFPASLMPSAALISAIAALKKLPPHHKRARAPQERMRRPVYRAPSLMVYYVRPLPEPPGRAKGGRGTLEASPPAARCYQLRPWTHQEPWLGSANDSQRNVAEKFQRIATAAVMAMAAAAAAAGASL